MTSEANKERISVGLPVDGSDETSVLDEKGWNNWPPKNIDRWTDVERDTFRRIIWRSWQGS